MSGRRQIDVPRHATEGIDQRIQVHELRAEFFNLFNHVNFANPVSNFNAVPSDSIDKNTGRIMNPADLGDFGRINSTSNNPRLIQLALKLNF